MIIPATTCATVATPAHLKQVDTIQALIFVNCGDDSTLICL
jgi:hypothetical protein